MIPTPQITMHNNRNNTSPSLPILQMPIHQQSRYNFTHYLLNQCPQFPISPIVRLRLSQNSPQTILSIKLRPALLKPIFLLRIPTTSRNGEPKDRLLIAVWYWSRC